MNTTQLRIVVAGLFFTFIFIFGFWLSRSGKPYSLFVFTLHKLIALGAIVFLAVMIYRVHQLAPLNPLQIAVILVTAILFVVTIATGGLISIDRAMPEIVQRLHQVTPYLALLSTSVLLYLLLVSGGEVLLDGI